MAPPPDRISPDQLKDQLGFRIFNYPLPIKGRAEFLAYLEKQNAPYSDAVVRDLMQLMMSTPDFQLC
jgi:hypothetical protein